MILFGALLQVFAEAGLVNAGLYPLALLSPAVLLFGFLWLRSGYTAWLRNPPPPTGAAAASVPFLTVGSFPPPPPP